MVKGIIGALAVARRRRLRQKQQDSFAAIAFQEDELLADPILHNATAMASVGSKTQRVVRHRHDMCVFLRQKSATNEFLRNAAMLRETARQKKEVLGDDSVTDGASAEVVRSWNGPMRSDMETSTDDQEVSMVRKNSKSSITSNTCIANYFTGNWQLTTSGESVEIVRRSLFVFTRKNIVRRICLRIASSAWLDQIILALIFLGSLIMAVDTPDVEEHHPTLKRWIQACDEVLLYIFTMEIVIKVIAFGLIWGPRTCLRDHWNKLDALVIVGGWVSMAMNQIGRCRFRGLILCAAAKSGGAPSGFSALRTIRILRPLRAIKQLPGLKSLVMALLKSLPELLDSLTLCAFVLVLFGIIGVQLFMGAFQQRCVPIGYEGDLASIGADLEFCRTNFSGAAAAISGANLLEEVCQEGFECRANTGLNPNSGSTSFDNLAYAMLAVFQSITLEGWVNIMYDIRKVKDVMYDIYFVSLLLFGSLFVANLVVGVLVANFMAEAGRLDDWKMPLKEDDRDDTDQRVDVESRCPRLRQLIQSPVFSLVVMGLILLNTIALALDNVISSELLEYLNYVFTSIFFVEMCMKAIGLGLRQYCRDHFNIFDTVIVMVSIVEIALDNAFDIQGPSTTVLRTFRLLRVFKLARSLTGLRKILDAILNSLGKMFYLGWLLLLFMFVCALMGMTFFGCTDDEANNPDAKWGFVEEPLYKGRLVRPNFSNFLYSMTTVFILITGENWNESMYIAVQRNSFLSAIFFVFIMVAGNYIVLNLFLAVLIEEFEKPRGENVEVEDQEDIDLKKKRIRRTTRSSKELVEEQGFSVSSLICITRDNRVRKAFWIVIRHQYFESFTHGLIAVSALMLALDTPSADPDTQRVVRSMDFMLTCFFTGEAILKIVVYGFVCGSHSYLSDAWNVLDFFVVVTSIGNLVLYKTTLRTELQVISWVKGLRALRALRPLRMVSRSEGMKQVVMAIFRAVPAIADVMLVSLLFLVIFSILGVQLLKDRFWRCSCQEYCPEKHFNPLGSLAEGKPPEQICQGFCPGAPAHLAKCAWERHPDWSFDNTAWAMLTLFEVSTLEQWPSVMWLAVDGGSWESGPEYNKSPLLVLFFIAFLFIVSFFILNLFVGVVIDKFTEVRNEINGSLMLTDRQRQWIAVQRMLLKARPRRLILPGGSRCRQLALQLIGMREFEVAILGVIIANVVVMCTSYHGASVGVQRIQNNSNLVFLAIFMAEATLKMYALRWLYFRDGWNTFDCTIVSGSLLAMAVNNSGEIQVIDGTMLRIFRIARIFRLVKSFNSLRKKFETLVLSLPSLVNVGAMLLLLFFVYAVAGMALFGDIEIKDNPHLREMNKDANFSSFYLALMMLLRMSTGESWNGIMHDCFSGARCAATGVPECGNTPLAIAFFISFMVIGSFVFLNLFIAVIVEKLFECDEKTNCEDVDCSITEEDLDNFVEVWARLAPEGGHYIPTAKLPDLLCRVDPPLGFCGEAITKGNFLRIVKNLGIRDHGGYVHFAEILWRLASMVAGADMRQFSDYEVLRTLDKHVIRAFPPPRMERSPSGCGNVVYLAAEVHATIKVQSRWRARQTQRMFRGILEAQGAAEKVRPIDPSIAQRSAVPEPANASSCDNCDACDDYVVDARGAGVATKRCDEASGSLGVTDVTHQELGKVPMPDAEKDPSSETAYSPSRRRTMSDSCPSLIDACRRTLITTAVPSSDVGAGASEFPDCGSEEMPSPPRPGSGRKAASWGCSETLCFSGAGTTAENESDQNVAILGDNGRPLFTFASVFL
mmetsp:Transcript_19833/g.54746  ORF Transcript_19833/g.54746 Transcript_19833/m.54746 type:complete len:1775 (-) Transcript_19833:180-5504(-)